MSENEGPVNIYTFTIRGSSMLYKFSNVQFCSLFFLIVWIATVWYTSKEMLTGWSVLQMFPCVLESDVFQVKQGHVISRKVHTVELLLSAKSGDQKCDCK